MDYAEEDADNAKNHKTFMKQMENRIQKKEANINAMLSIQAAVSKHKNSKFKLKGLKVDDIIQKKDVKNKPSLKTLVTIKNLKTLKPKLKLVNLANLKANSPKDPNKILPAHIEGR